MRFGGFGFGQQFGFSAPQALPASFPSNLFAVADTGLVLDPHDRSTVYQDTAGATPGAVGSQVLRLVDKAFGRALTNSAGPTLRADGLEFDGTDDALALNFTLNQPWTCISAIRQKSWTNGDQIHGGGANNAGALLQTGSTPQIGMFDGSAIIGTLSATLNTWFVVTRFHSGASSSIQLNDAAATTGNPGTTGPGGLTLGKRPGVETYANYDQGRHFCINRALTAAETAAVKTWVGAPVGVVL